MNGTQFIRLAPIVAGLFCSMLAARAQAAPMVQLTAQLESLTGEVSQASDLLVVGPDRVEAEARTTQDVAIAAAHATFEVAPINQYVIGLAPPVEFEFLNGAVWWAKTSAHLHIRPTWQFADASVEATRTRGIEKYAVYAVAPNSASGFAANTEPSTLGGPGIRLLISGYFNGGIYTDHYLDDDDVPHFSYGASFADVLGAPPEPDFNSTLQLYNQGFALVVDLDAAGVAVGDDYVFREHIRLGVGPGVFLGPLQEAFVNIDPVVGFAEIPEPKTTTMILVALAAALPRSAARRRRLPPPAPRPSRGPGGC